MVAEEVHNNPHFIRELVEAFIQAHYSSEFIQQTWENHGRPPYKEWDKYPVQRLLFVDTVKEPLISKLNPRSVDSKVLEF